MEFFKCVVLPFIAIVTAWLGDADVGASREWVYGKLRLPQKVRKFVLLTFSAVAIISGAVLKYLDDKEAGRKDDANRRQIDTLQKDLQASRAEQKATHEDLKVARADLSRANEKIVLQSRSIASLMFSLGTSEEGKERFARVLKDVFRILDFTQKEMEMAELICADGVAMYVFRPDGRLTDFHFFSNSQINEILAGLSLEGKFTPSGDMLVLDRSSEIVKTIERAWEWRLPEMRTDPMEQSWSLQEVERQLEIILRYVCRAEKVAFHSFDDGAESIEFDYYVNPLDKKYRRSARLDYSPGEMRLLYGMRMGDFAARVVNDIYEKQIMPKMNLRDVRYCNKAWRRNVMEKNSPFTSRASPGI